MSEHNNIIGHVAKAALAPLGFYRKGRSRTWLADHGWWLTVVEFQPSSWSKGCYLNVGAHWLWQDDDDLSFDFGGRVEGHEAYRNDEQFTRAAAHLAELAADEAKRLANLFSSIEATADVLLQEHLQLREEDRTGWTTYHAGVTAGLVGRISSATEMLATVPTSVSSKLAEVAHKPELFRREVISLIAQRRVALKLAPLADPLG